MGTSKLASYLIKDGILSLSDCQIIAKDRTSRGAAFAKVIIALGIFTEKTLAEYLRKKTGFELLGHGKFLVTSPEAVGSIDVPLMQYLEVIPISLEGQTLKVAMADPLDQATIQQLQFFTNLRIKPAIVTFSSLYKSLGSYIGGFRAGETSLEKMLKSYQSKHASQLSYTKEKSRAPSSSKSLSHSAGLPQATDELDSFSMDSFEDSQDEIGHLSHEDEQSLNSVENEFEDADSLPNDLFDSPLANEETPKDLDFSEQENEEIGADLSDDSFVMNEAAALAEVDDASSESLGGDDGFFMNAAAQEAFSQSLQENPIEDQSANKLQNDEMDDLFDESDSNNSILSLDDLVSKSEVESNDEANSTDNTDNALVGLEELEETLGGQDNPIRVGAFVDVGPKDSTYEFKLQQAISAFNYGIARQSLIVQSQKAFSLIEETFIKALGIEGFIWQKADQGYQLIYEWNKNESSNSLIHSSNEWEDIIDSATAEMWVSVHPLPKEFTNRILPENELVMRAVNTQANLHFVAFVIWQQALYRSDIISQLSGIFLGKTLSHVGKKSSSLEEVVSTI